MQRRGLLDGLTVVAISSIAACFSSSSAPPGGDAGLGSESGPEDATAPDGDSAAVTDGAASADVGPAPGAADSGQDAPVADAAEADAVTDSSPEAAPDAPSGGSLYVVGGNSPPGPSIAVFDTTASASQAPRYTITGTFFTNPEWIACDPHDNLLYVMQGEQVLVFAGGATSPSRTITSTALLGNIRSIGADVNGNVYVGAPMLVNMVTANGIAVFGPTAGMGATPTTVFSSTMLGTLMGIAIDASGNVYLASENQSGGYNLILEFGPNPSGAATPIRTIGGGPNSHIGQSGLGPIVVDASGNVYASVFANAYNPADSIEVYGPSVSGDQAPTREIVGSATKLASPTSIALDAAGNLYASNAGTPSEAITTYAPGANGNQAPIRTLFPTTTGGYATGGIGIAVGP